MESKKSTGKLYCLISAIIIIGCYAVQRVLSLCVDANRTLAVCEAMIFSLAVAAVYFLVTKSHEPFYGILISVLGFRMLPPSISALEEFSSGAYIVYYIVGRASLVIFAFAIIKLFRQQETEQKIGVLPILFLMIAVPFSNEISSTLASFADGYANGNKLWGYFIQFAFYALTMLIGLWYASRSNYINSRLICDYSIVALALNLARRLSVTVIYLARDWHISKSYFCWMAIYIFFIVAYFILKRKKTKEA